MKQNTILSKQLPILVKNTKQNDIQYINTTITQGLKYKKGRHYLPFVFKYIVNTDISAGLTPLILLA